MTLADVAVALTDNNLGLQPGSSENLVNYVGPCSGGTPNTLYEINSLDGLDDLGDGPLVNYVRLALDVSGGPVFATPVTQSAGSNGSVTHVGSGPTMTVSGTPHDAFNVMVSMVAAGVVGTSQFTLSLDGGATTSDPIFTASTYPIPGTGLTLAFPSGTYVLGDTYAFTSTAPSTSVANMNAALDAAFADGREFGLVHIIGEASSAANCATAAAALQSKLDTAAGPSMQRPTRGFVEAPRSATDAEMIAAFASFVGQRALVIAGGGVILEAGTGRSPTVHIARAVLAKIVGKPIGKDPAQVKPEKGCGPLPAQVLSITRDEFKNPGLDSKRFTTVRTLVGQIGFFVTNAWLMSQSGSDYRYLHHGQVIDAFHVTVRNRLLNYLSLDLDVKPDGSGQLTEGACSDIDANCDSAARKKLVQPGHATNVQVSTVRTDDVLSTETIRVKGSVVPKVYPKTIELSIGFSRSISNAA